MQTRVDGGSQLQPLVRGSHGPKSIWEHSHSRLAAAGPFAAQGEVRWSGTSHVSGSCHPAYGITLLLDGLGWLKQPQAFILRRS